MPTITVPPLTALPTSPLDRRWEALPHHALTHFHARSSDHHPVVTAQLGHSQTHLHLRFSVHDAFVLSEVTTLNGQVCTDSCVEFFVEPIPGLGYFNLEMNAGGTIHCSHISDPTPTPSGFAKYAMLSTSELASISIATTLPRIISPEIASPLDWALCATIPIDLFSKRLGRTPPVPGTWRANFYKCADRSSHPHWASWSPIGERLAFHVPEHFGTLELT